MARKVRRARGPSVDRRPLPRSPLASRGIPTRTCPPLGGDLAGRLVVTAGLGGMAGAQPLAVTGERRPRARRRVMECDQSLVRPKRLLGDAREAEDLLVETRRGQNLAPQERADDATRLAAGVGLGSRIWFRLSARLRVHPTPLARARLRRTRRRYTWCCSLRSDRCSCSCRRKHLHNPRGVRRTRSYGPHNSSSQDTRHRSRRSARRSLRRRRRRLRTIARCPRR